MRFESFSFGSIRINGVTHEHDEHDLVIDRGEIRKRKKGVSKEYRAASSRARRAATVCWSLIRTDESQVTPRKVGAHQRSLPFPSSGASITIPDCANRRR